MHNNAIKHYIPFKTIKIIYITHVLKYNTIVLSEQNSHPLFL